jgi:hypothetical protein
MAWLRIAATLATACVAAHCFGRPVEAQDSTEGLAAAAQNPVAAMYSLPFQNNTYFGAGPNHDKTANVLNIQPVLPFTVGGMEHHQPHHRAADLRAERQRRVRRQ